MKTKGLIVSTLVASALLAQGPGDPGPGGPQMGPDRRMGMRRLGMRGPGMEREQRMAVRDRDGGPREIQLGALLGDPNVRQQLGVTADQAAKIRQQESDFRKGEIRNRADLQIKRMDLEDLLSADKPDRSAINNKIQEVGAAQTALEKSAIDNRLNMREALTPAQRQKLPQIMSQRRQSMADGNAAARGPQGGRGGAPQNAPGRRPPNQ